MRQSRTQPCTTPHCKSRNAADCPVFALPYIKNRNLRKEFGTTFGAIDGRLGRVQPRCLCEVSPKAKSFRTRVAKRQVRLSRRKYCSLFAMRRCRRSRARLLRPPIPYIYSIAYFHFFITRAVNPHPRAILPPQKTITDIKKRGNSAPHRNCINYTVSTTTCLPIKTVEINRNNKNTCRRKASRTTRKRMAIQYKVGCRLNNKTAARKRPQRAAICSGNHKTN